MVQRSKVFVSYSHKDTAWLERLQVHLKPLVRDGLDLWDDTRIAPGQKWEEEIREALEATRVAILLISADFLASDFIHTNELPPLLTAAENGGVVIMPLILNPSRFKKTPLSKFQAVNPLNQPLKGMKDTDQEAWLVKVSDAVEAALNRSMEAQEHREGTPLRRIWNVPPKNFSFTGRDTLLANIQAELTTRGRAMLSGLGGIGKTQIAVEHAHRHRDQYEAVLWVAADTTESLMTGYASLARVLDLPAQHDVDQQQVVLAVTEWLETNNKWLLIFDGADEPEWLEALLLDSRGHLKPFLREAWGHLLITTRAQQAQRLGFPQGFQTTKMTPEEALEFFSVRMSREIGNSEAEAAAALSQELDGLPLALEQAAAFMVQIQCPLDDYLKSYRKQRLALLEKAAPMMGGSHEPLTTTWSLNFEAVEQVSPAAADLLRLSSFLAPIDIPLELVSKGAGVIGPELAATLKDVGTDPLALSQLLEPLTRYSLIRRDVAQRSFSLHRLVQEVVKSQMPAAMQQAWAGRMVRALHRGFPRNIYAEWNSVERLVPHAVHTRTVIEAYSLELAEAIQLLDRAGMYMFELHNYTDAASFYTQALGIARQVYGERKADYSTQLVNLARVSIAQKEFDEARLYLDRAIEIDREVLGRDHPDFAVTLTEAGRLDQKMGDYPSALLRIRQAHKIMTDYYGDIHEQVATSWHNLAELSHEMGNLKEAEQHYKRALAIYEMILDRDNPRIATTQHNLGAVYRDLGQYAPALAHYRRALEIRRKVLSGSRDYMASLHEVAVMCNSGGDYNAAVPLLQEELDAHREAFGTRHSKYLSSLNLLAEVYAGMGNYAEAERLYREQIEIRTQTVGRKDKRYTASLYNLAIFYFQTEKYDTAESAFLDLIDTERLFLKWDDPQFLVSRSGLALVYEKTGRLEEAAEIYEAVIKIRREYPEDKRNLSIELYQLAQLYLNMQTNYSRAEQLLLEVVEIERKTIGEDHPDFAMTLNGLAWVYELTGKYQEAKACYEQALQIQVRAFGKDHPIVRKTLGRLYGLIGKMNG